jgi:Trypsin-like peptidase domain
MNKYLLYARNKLIATTGLFACFSFFSAYSQQSETDSVVTIYSTAADGTSKQGTGFYIDSRGKVLTAYHVVRNAIKIEIYNKKLEKIEGVRINRIDERRDLALLNTSASSTPKLDLEGGQPTAFSITKIAGSPRGLPRQVMEGKLTAETVLVDSIAISSAGGKRVFRESIDVIPIDITVYSGMSGAPAILPSSGKVIGVLSGSFDNGRGVAWAIPVKYVTALLERPPIDRPPSETFAWPRLSLMADGWVSLERSYGAAFDSLHLAKLESLEGAIRVLKGSWRGVSENRITTYSGYAMGTCSASVKRTLELDIQRVDVSIPQLIGRHKFSFQSLGVESHPAAFASDTMKAALREQCRTSTTSANDKGITHGTGRFSAKSAIDEDYPVDTKGLETSLFIEDCQWENTGNCPAAFFGLKKSSRIEVITPARIRWEGIILDRVN